MTDFKKGDLVKITGIDHVSSHELSHLNGTLGIILDDNPSDGEIFTTKPYLVYVQNTLKKIMLFDDELESLNQVVNND